MPDDAEPLIAAQQDKGFWRHPLVIGVAGGAVVALATIAGQNMSGGAAARLKSIELRYSEAAKAYTALLQSLDGLSDIELTIMEIESQSFPDRQTREAAMAVPRERLRKSHEVTMAAARQLGPYLSPAWRDWLADKLLDYESLSEFPTVDMAGNVITPTIGPRGPLRDRNVVSTELEHGLLLVLFDWTNEIEFPATPVAGTVPTPRIPYFLLPTPLQPEPHK